MGVTIRPRGGGGGGRRRRGTSGEKYSEAGKEITDSWHCEYDSPF